MQSGRSCAGITPASMYRPGCRCLRPTWDTYPSRRPNTTCRLLPNLPLRPAAVSRVATAHSSDRSPTEVHHEIDIPEHAGTHGTIFLHRVSDRTARREPAYRAQ